MIFNGTLICLGTQYDTLSESQKETEYLDESYDDDVKPGKHSPREIEYLDESYDDDVKTEERVDEG